MIFSDAGHRHRNGDRSLIGRIGEQLREGELQQLLAASPTATSSSGRPITPAARSAAARDAGGRVLGEPDHAAVVAEVVVAQLREPVEAELDDHRAVERRREVVGEHVGAGLGLEQRAHPLRRRRTPRSSRRPAAGARRAGRTRRPAPRRCRSRRRRPRPARTGGAARARAARPRRRSAPAGCAAAAAAGARRPASRGGPRRRRRAGRSPRRPRRRSGPLQQMATMRDRPRANGRQTGKARRSTNRSLKSARSESST